MQARDEVTGAGMTDRQLRDEVMTLMLAGHETTANLLTWTWYLLAQHPDIEAKLHAELVAVLNGRVATFDDLPALPYTRMVIDETLRLYPPAYVIARFASGADQVGGYAVPKHAVVTLSPYITHRHPEFWREPDRFDPERFNPAQAASRPRFAYLPFGAGPRQCIGRDFALVEATIILATTAQSFQPRLAAPAPVEIEPLITLRPRGGMPMFLQPR